MHATAASGWSLSGSILTFAFPMGLFIVAAAVLYLQFSRPHQIPGHRKLVPAQAAPPDPGTAQAMAAAGGMGTAVGGGAAPLAHEPAGAPEAAEAAVQDDGGPPGQPGDGSPRRPGPGPDAGHSEAGQPEAGQPEAGE
jgi:hypothetical protein